MGGFTIDEGNHRKVVESDQYSWLLVFGFWYNMFILDQICLKEISPKEKRKV